MPASGPPPAARPPVVPRPPGHEPGRRAVRCRNVSEAIEGLASPRSRRDVGGRVPARGHLRLGQPDPSPRRPDPIPDSLRHVAVIDDRDVPPAASARGHGSTIGSGLNPRARLTIQDTFQAGRADQRLILVLTGTLRCGLVAFATTSVEGGDEEHGTRFSLALVTKHRGDPARRGRREGRRAQSGRRRDRRNQGHRFKRDLRANRDGKSSLARTVWSILAAFRPLSLRWTASSVLPRYSEPAQAPSRCSMSPLKLPNVCSSHSLPGFWPEGAREEGR